MRQSAIAVVIISTMLVGACAKVEKPQVVAPGAVTAVPSNETYLLVPVAAKGYGLDLVFSKPPAEGATFRHKRYGCENVHVVLNTIAGARRDENALTASEHKRAFALGKSNDGFFDYILFRAPPGRAFLSRWAQSVYPKPLEGRGWLGETIETVLQPGEINYAAHLFLDTSEIKPVSIDLPGLEADLRKMGHGSIADRLNAASVTMRELDCSEANKGGISMSFEPCRYGPPGSPDALSGIAARDVFRPH